MTIRVLNYRIGFVLLSFIFLFISDSFSQLSSFCGADLQVSSSSSIDTPSRSIDSRFSSDDLLTIRTVVHIVYNKDEENIDDEQIEFMIDQLNDYFLAINVNTSLINPIHKPKISNTRIQFCLATEDPSGASSIGITRTQTDSTQFQMFDLESEIVYDFHKDYNTGGAAPWDISGYLNIWIIQAGGTESYLNSAVPKSGHYPFANYIVDDLIPGVTYDVDNFFADSSSFFQPTNVLAHECGHFLGLLHTFGIIPENLAEMCDVDDEIDDTPLCSFSFCDDLSANTCIESQDDEPDNVSNFMNYGCQLMITTDQALTMRNNLLSVSQSLLTDSDCIGVFSSSEAYDADLSFVVFPNPTSGEFIVKIDGIVVQGDFNFTVYDIQGKEVEKLITSNSLINENELSLFIDTPGIYFVIMQSGKLIETRKVVVGL